MNPSAGAGNVASLALERALALPAEHGLIAFTGPPASGKTEALVRRFAALLAGDASLAEAAIVTAARDDGARALAARIGAATGVPVRGATLDALALELLRAHPLETGLALDLELIDPLEAEEIFERAAAPLFSAEWSDWLGADVDPEIAGLRTPDRFAGAALRLIRKLRDAGIDDEAFLVVAQRGATTFYANPPNLASPALLAATKDEHRASLAVDVSELDRQRRRELDLAKILARLYRAYVDELVRRGCLTAADALAEATRLLESRPAIARALRRRLRVAFVDDAHDLPAAALRFLRALFGDALDGVAVAGDPDAATQTFAGARPERVFGRAKTTVVLAPRALHPQIAALARAIVDADPARPVPAGDAVRVLRTGDRFAEAELVAERVVSLLRAGTPPARIAVVHRTLRTLGTYEDALLARDVPVALAGDPALFERHDVLDALSLLWTAVDPFRHEWLLRALQTPMSRLSDASISVLCGEPASPQPALFAIPEAEPDGERRWDRKRDLRLATNVLRGERDADLSPVARERVTALRARRARWTEWLRATDAETAARAIVEDGGLLLPRRGETAARARSRAALVARLIALIGSYAARHPFETLAGALAHCERLANGEQGPELLDERDDAVVVASVERILARRFDHVFVVDARAGSFPPYYVPDAFLFSTTYGMIPKDAAGDALAARTAKFTWYEHHAKPRAAYVREQRRLFAVALCRADASVTISASGKATRGIAAPELTAEAAALLANAR
ncbi:MAG TPA: UvrD-helicase domain-containing protein [Candidatus Elarobacter sp.]|jgi:superfamily I DNA/RNA helicase|nr:UvrD-helicase domain-containing protein [Candidatus Elarobacter sp.]